VLVIGGGGGGGIKGQFVGTPAATLDAVFDARSVSLANHVVTLQWTASPGQWFDVQSSADLKEWTTRAPGITSATSAYSWSGPVTGGRDFFRLAQ
jgi:hypothetical protein